MTITLRTLWIGLLLILLAGCSGAPDDADIQSALQTHMRKQIRDAEDQARSIAGEGAVSMMHKIGSPKPEDITVDDVEILESRELDNGDYEIRARLVVATGDDSNTSTQKFFMRDTDDGWRAEIAR